MLRTRLLTCCAALLLACCSETNGGTPPEASGPADPADALGETTPGPDTKAPPDGAATGDVAPDGAGTEDAPFVPEEGGLGWPCTENADCKSGFCIESTEGFICTQTCLADCPEGFSCKSVVNTRPDVVFVCVPDVLKLCQPCKTDAQCNGGRCLVIEDETQQPHRGSDLAQSHCTAPCDDGSPCPTSYACQEIVSQATGLPVSVCLPSSGSCDCTADDTGLARTCTANNEHGTCQGFQVCLGEGGWDFCSAPTPSAESCDGKDNDCDGLVDEGAGSGDVCTNTNEHGTCKGVLTCILDSGPVCSAAVPVPEQCDYKDNDCDGQTDEAFKNPAGQYMTDEHCGECGKSCVSAIANALAKCDSETLVPPQCVVDKCVAGYYKLNPFLCSPIPGQLCDPCTTDANCAAADGKCVELSDGTFCATPCAAGEACPSGYTCSDFDGLWLCKPDTGSCGCDGSNPLLQKACEKVWQDPADPDAPVVTCQGVQKCKADGWGGCEMPADACDGTDNDCDGVVDGPWVNGDGFYDKDQNCGICGNNCLAKPYPHAKGSCDTSSGFPQCSVTCNDGWFDVNANAADGCECQHTSETDHPDGVDQNCDGIDGEVLNGVFVSKSGDDANPGTIDAPVLTIQGGIDKAKDKLKRDVYVATGVYAQNIALLPAVAVYGGYSGDFHSRDTKLYETAILGAAPTPEKPAAVNAANLGGPAEKASKLNGFTVFGYDNKVFGASSYGIRVLDCGDQLSIEGNRIFAGNGGNGMPGVPGGSGAKGKNGAPGNAAYDIGTNGCAVKHHNPGGAGGLGSCGGTDTSGGNGGTAACPDFDEDTPPGTCAFSPYKQTTAASENGVPGKGPGAGAGGAAGFDALIDIKNGPYNDYQCNSSPIKNCSSCLLLAGENKHGDPGLSAGDGTPGPKGKACTAIDGAVTGHLWQPQGAASGANGTHGGGGGGGGAAGSVETTGCSDQYAKYHDIGGSGGGGGAGGCAGTGGGGGEGGGGSFAIMISWSKAPATVPKVAGNLIVRGDGGLGGNGGPGGTGGPGGDGGAAGSSGQSEGITFCTATGGTGGPGGQGGHGGGGGGGCGGVSFGIYVTGGPGTAAWKTSNTFDADGSPGAGGLGGASLGQPGDDGLTGASGATNF